MAPIGLNFCLGKIIADGSIFFSELDGKRQTDVTETNYCNDSHDLTSKNELNEYL